MFTPLSGTTTAKPTPSFTPIGGAAITPAPTQTSSPASFWSDPIGATKNYLGSSATQAVDFEKQLLTHPVKTVTSLPDNFAQHIIDSFKSSFQQGTDAVGAIGSDYNNKTGSTAGDVANLAKLATSVAGVLFSPISGSFAAAQDYPGLRQASDAANLPFQVTGAAGGYVGGKAVDIAPIPQESKDILRKPISDLTSLVAQIALGGRIVHEVSKRIQGGETITPEVATSIVEDTNPTLVDFSERAKEAPVAPETAPTAELAPRTGEVAPTVTETPQISIPPELQSLAEEAQKYSNAQEFVKTVSESTDGSLKPELDALVAQNKDLITALKAQSGEVTPAQISHQLLTDFYNKAIAENPKPTAIGGTKVTKAASDINTALVKQGMENIPPELLSKYTEGSYKGSAERAAQLMSENLDKAKEMAITGENIPYDIHPQILFNAMEALANKMFRENKDASLLHELGKSPLGTQLSEAAGTMGSHGFNDNPNSTVKVIRDVTKTREAAAEKRSGSVKKAQIKDASTFKTEVKKARSSRPTWEEFAKEIACNY